MESVCKRQIILLSSPLFSWGRLITVDIIQTSFVDWVTAGIWGVIERPLQTSIRRVYDVMRRLQNWYFILTWFTLIVAEIRHSNSWIFQTQGCLLTILVLSAIESASAWQDWQNHTIWALARIVEASNVIRVLSVTSFDPKCNKGPKCIKAWLVW